MARFSCALAALVFSVTSASNGKRRCTKRARVLARLPASPRDHGIAVERPTSGTSDNPRRPRGTWSRGSYSGSPGTHCRRDCSCYHRNRRRSFNRYSKVLDNTRSMAPVRLTRQVYGKSGFIGRPFFIRGMPARTTYVQAPNVSAEGHRLGEKNVHTCGWMFRRRFKRTKPSGRQ